MTVTIFEALQNADFNLENYKSIGMFAVEIAKSQLHNAVVLLEKGYPLSQMVEELLDQYDDDVERVPECGG